MHRALLAATLFTTLPAHAGDRVFVLNGDGTIEAYSDSGTALGVVTLSNSRSAFDIEPSVGGRWLYVADTQGDLHFVNPAGLVTSQGAGPGPGLDGKVSASPDRANVYLGAGRLYRFDTSSLASQGAMVSGSDFDAIAENPRDPTVIYAARNLTGLMAYDTSGFNDTTLDSAEARADVAVNAFDQVVSVWQDGSDMVVQACDPATGNCNELTETGVDVGAGSIDAAHTEFYVATDAGVFAYIATSSTFVGLPTGAFASAYVRDVAVDANDDVWVLYDDRLEKWDHLGSSGTTVVSFGDEDDRYQVVVVPVPDPEARPCALCLRAGLYEIVAAAEVLRINLPWFADHEGFDCTDCTEEDMKDAAEAAEAFLDGFEEGGELTVADVITFFQKLEGITAAEAEWALDDLLIQPEGLDDEETGK